jgi:hypothetical protein
VSLGTGAGAAPIEALAPLDELLLLLLVLAEAQLLSEIKGLDNSESADVEVLDGIEAAILLILVKLFFIKTLDLDMIPKCRIRSGK